MPKTITTPCKCRRATLTQTGPRSMSRCPKCGVKYGFSVNIDGTAHLFINGKRPLPETHRKRSYSVSWSPHQDAKTKAAGYTRQRLLEYAYNKLILDTE